MFKTAVSLKPSLACMKINVLEGFKVVMIDSEGPKIIVSVSDETNGANCKTNFSPYGNSIVGRGSNNKNTSNKYRVSETDLGSDSSI